MHFLLHLRFLHVLVSVLVFCLFFQSIFQVEFLVPSIFSGETSVISSNLLEYDFDKYKDALARAGPINSYKTLEARIMVSKAIPISPQGF